MYMMELEDIRLHAVRVFTGVSKWEQLEMAEAYCTRLLKHVKPEDEDNVADMLSWLLHRATKNVDADNLYPTQSTQMENYGENEIPDYLIVPVYYDDGNG